MDLWRLLQKIYLFVREGICGLAEILHYRFEVTFLPMFGNFIIDGDLIIDIKVGYLQTCGSLELALLKTCNSFLCGFMKAF